MSSILKSKEILGIFDCFIAKFFNSVQRKMYFSLNFDRFLLTKRFLCAAIPSLGNKSTQHQLDVQKPLRTKLRSVSGERNLNHTVNLKPENLFCSLLGTLVQQYVYDARRQQIL